MKVQTEDWLITREDVELTYTLQCVQTSPEVAVLMHVRSLAPGSTAYSSTRMIYGEEAGDLYDVVRTTGECTVPPHVTGALFWRQDLAFGEDILDLFG